MQRSCASRRANPLPIIFFAALSATAHGVERTGDRLISSEIRHYAKAVTTVQSDLLSMIASAPDDRRFALYRTYNHSIGSSIQVDVLQTLLEGSIADTSDSAENAARAALREQASYTLWELGQNIDELETVITASRPSDDLRMHELLRSLLIEMRVVLTRLASQP